MTMNFCIKLEGSDILENFPHFYCSRSSHRWCSGRNGVVRNFGKVTGKHLCRSLLLNKSTGQSAALLKKEILTQVFSYEFCKILNIPGRLLLLFPFSSREIAKNRTDLISTCSEIRFFIFFLSISGTNWKNKISGQNSSNCQKKFLRLFDNLSWHEFNGIS